MKSRHKRLAMIAAGIAALGIALALVLNAFRSNLVFFFTPSEIAANEAPLAYPFLQQNPDGKGTWDIFHMSKLTYLAHCNRVSGPGSGCAP